MKQSNEFHVEQAESDWEVRNRADVFVAAFPSFNEARSDAAKRNKEWRNAR